MNFFKMLLLVMTMTFTIAAEARSTRVRSYIKKDGTYVGSHYRTSPNRTRYDNYSTRGNYNPYTGKKGYKNPYR